MSINDFWDKDHVFRVPKEKIDNLRNKIQRNDTCQNENVDGSQEEETSDSRDLINEICRILDCENDISAMDKMIINSIVFDTNVKILNSNEIIEIDTKIINGIISSYYISVAGYKYSDHLINEFEQSFLTCLGALYDIKGFNIYSLYEDRKKFLCKYLVDQMFDDFIEQACLLLGNDYDRESFESFNEASPIKINDIFIDTALRAEFYVITEKTRKENSQLVKMLSEAKYEKVLREDADKKLFCRKCGRELPPDSDFCMYCGTHVEHTTGGKWGEGIPEYTASDCMNEQDIFEFAAEIIFKEVIKNNLEIVSSTSKMNEIPTFVVKENDQLIFILVEADVAPNIPQISKERREQYIIHAKKFNAKALYASVGIGSADPDRFNAGLALRDDKYYVRFNGFENILYL
ncbi:MAG: zinc ribbon domain-containing protein [Lachnospiraceae bacterium]|nr:zinc ribbon domain-containing protein [Lachnospiraceae bacterium]